MKILATLFALLLLSAIPARAQTLNDPLLVDAVGTSTNDSVDAGNGFVVYLPQAALANNLIVCGLTYDYSASRTLTITDSSGTNTWHVAVTQNNGTTNTNAIVYASGVVAGTQRLTFTFDAALNSFQAACKEAYGIATSSPLDGISSADGSGSGITGATIASGSISTSVNGDLIFQYGNNFVQGNELNALSQLVTGFTPGTGWSPIIADVQTGQYFQDFLQSTAGSITPSYGVSSSTSFATVAAAFKTSSGVGTQSPPVGIHIDHQYTIVLGGGNNATSQFPSDGNFLAVAATDTSNTMTVSDSKGNGYTRDQAGVPGDAILWYATGATTDSALKISLTNSGAGNTEFVLRDIRGVATSSPIDTTAFDGDLQSSFSAGTTITSAPVITPSAAGELLILAMQNGCGPPQIVSSPSGVTMDSVWFTGQIDADTFDEGEGHAHFLTTGTGQISVTWTMQNTGCSGNGNAYGVGAWLIKPGSSQGAPPAPPTNLRVTVF
jgi:hypothetical protein